MSWFRDFFSGFRFSPTDTSRTISRRLPSGIKFFEYNGETNYINTGTADEIKEAFEKCAPLSAIIGYAGRAFADGKLEVLNANTDNYVRGQYKSWDKFLSKPNPFQNGQQFMKQLYIYTKINGFSFALVNWAAGFKGSGEPPTSMYVLPYWLIDIKKPRKGYADITLNDILDNVYLEDGTGQPKKLPKENLVLIRDTTGVIDEDYHLPISRVALNKYPISTIMSVAEAEVSMIQERGAVGILSNRAQDDAGHVALNPSEKEDVQKELGKYGLSRSQRKLIVTNANLEFQPINFPIKDMLLHESYTKGIKDLCDAFGVPFELMSHSDRKNLSNVKSFDKILYQNTIIPDANDISSQLTIGLGLDELKSPIYIAFDYSEVAALQQSEEEKGKGLSELVVAMQKMYDLGIVTKNMILEKMGEDTVTGKPEFDMYKYEIDAQNVQNTQQQGNSQPNAQQQV